MDSPRTEPTSVKRVAIVGTGVIGSGWAALFLAHGYEVTAYVRSLSSEAKAMAAVEDAWGKLSARGVAKETEGWRKLTCVFTIAECVANADYVQESVTEDLTFKQQIVAQIDQHAPPHVLIGSSSSYLTRSLVALKCAAHPQRVVTVHPSLPQWDNFVELLALSTEDTAWLHSFFSGVGMDVIVMRHENYGHVLNCTLMGVMSTSNLIAHSGICDTKDIDVATAHLGRILLINGGVTTAFCGMVGGGSAQVSPFSAATRTLRLGAPCSSRFVPDAPCMIHNDRYRLTHTPHPSQCTVGHPTRH